MVENYDYFRDLRFQNGMAPITLAALSKSASLMDFSGRPSKSKPIDHHEMISLLLNKWKAAMGDVKIVSEIFVYKDHSQRFNFRDVDITDVPISNIIFKKVIGRFSVEAENDTEILPSLAFIVNEKGYTVGIGPEVRICKNFNIFGANLFTTYGSDRVSFENLVSFVDAYLEKWRENFEYEKRIILRFKSHSVGHGNYLWFLGVLIEQAVLANMVGSKIESPISVTQVHRIIEEANRQIAGLAHGVDITAWDIANFGTYVLDAKRNGSDSYINQIQNWLNLIARSFEITLED